MKVAIAGKCKWLDDALDVSDAFLRTFHIGIHMGTWRHVFHIVKKNTSYLLVGRDVPVGVQYIVFNKHDEELHYKYHIAYGFKINS